MSGSEEIAQINGDVVSSNQPSANEPAAGMDHREHMKPTPNWDDLSQARDYNPAFAAWFQAQDDVSKEIWMDVWVQDDLDVDHMYWRLERCQVDEDVAEAQLKVHNAPAEFQAAAERGDLEAMGKFLAERIRNQAAGKEWK
jgi:hypothetical protein